MLDLVVAKDWQALEDSMQQIMLEQLQALPPDQQAALGDPEEAMRRRIPPQIEAMKSPWFQNFLTYDVGQDWAKTTVPVLALFGGLDVQVDADQNSPALKAALEKAKNPDVTMKVFPDANHLFQKAEDRERSGVCYLARRFRTGLSGHYRRLVARACQYKQLRRDWNRPGYVARSVHLSTVYPQSPQVHDAPGETFLVHFGQLRA